ncbi:MAG: hypothetical protein HUJ78_05040 [Mogibacterium sp.]|nr:hypothetical protein [Mogibacterium sp.]
MVHRTLLGFCGWDIPAAIVLIAVIVALVIRNRKLKNKERELEERVLGMSDNGNGLEKEAGTKEDAEAEK